MKKCPRCGTQYSDDTLSYCLQDGTPLVGPEAETPTVVLGETETVVPRRDGVHVPITSTDPAGWGQSQATRIPPKPPTKSSYTVLAVLATAVGMLLLFGIIGLAAILFYRSSQQAGIQNVSLPPKANVSVPNPNTNLYQSPSVSVSPVHTPTSSSPVSTPPRSSATPAVPAPPVLSSYPSTTRLKFARGAYSTSFGGEINPGDSRTLVLACRNGQSLSANVSSGRGCVSFRGGGGSLALTTNSGDNYLTVTNNCSSVAHFSVSISVF